MLYNLRANPTDDPGAGTMTLVLARGAPIACWRPYCPAMATRLRSYYNTVMAFVLSMLKVGAVYAAFYAIPQRLLALPLRCWLAPQRSAFFLDAVGSLRDCRSVVTGLICFMRFLVLITLSI